MGRAEYLLFKRRGKKGEVWYVRFWSETDQNYVETEWFEKGVIPNGILSILCRAVRSPSSTIPLGESSSLHWATLTSL
jgi:hypothetical protein